MVQAFLDELGIMDPTEVQAAAIPRVLQGGNVAIQCYTGSGKVCTDHKSFSVLEGFCG
jgi:superfamily II DNA/RNA helicase